MATHESEVSLKNVMELVNPDAHTKDGKDESHDKHKQKHTRREKSRRDLSTSNEGEDRRDKYKQEKSKSREQIRDEKEKHITIVEEIKVERKSSKNLLAYKELERKDSKIERRDSKLERKDSRIVERKDSTRKHSVRHIRSTSTTGSDEATSAFVMEFSRNVELLHYHSEPNLSSLVVLDDPNFKKKVEESVIPDSPAPIRSNKKTEEKESNAEDNKSKKKEAKEAKQSKHKQPKKTHPAIQLIKSAISSRIAAIASSREEKQKLREVAGRLRRHTISEAASLFNYQPRDTTTPTAPPATPNTSEEQQKQQQHVDQQHQLQKFEQQQHELQQQQLLLEEQQRQHEQQRKQLQEQEGNEEGGEEEYAENPEVSRVVSYTPDLMRYADVELPPSLMLLAH